MESYVIGSVSMKTDDSFGQLRLKDLSLASRLLLRIHGSAPYRRHSRTQFSVILFEERGLSLPWKIPLPLAKKALLFFSMLFFTQRLGNHHAPRHLAEFVSGICSWPASMYDRFAGVEGEITALHFSMFSVRPCDEAKSLTRLIWHWQWRVYGCHQHVRRHIGRD